MENGWSLFNNHHHHNSSSSGSTSGTRGGHNGHCNNNLAWDIWDLGTSRFDWTNSFHEVHAPSSTTAAAAPTAVTTTTYQEASAVHALMLSHHHQQPPPQQQQQQGMASLYAGGGSYYQPDPHLMCLKLGKRHYFEDATALGDRHLDDGLSVVAKRGRSPYHGGGGINVGPSGMTTSPASAAVTVAVPRCQVEGCHVALVEAKEYHRRHKVCEMHAKAPKVVVLGLDQRFCQQCSRFHAVTEFDETKRSCRRRLAGHNERRRKGSTHDSIHPKIPAQGRAHSLLSSKNSSWFSSADLSSRCSAALHELIAENRAAILARQLVHDPTQPAPNNSLLTYHHHHHLFSEPRGWDRFNHEGGGGHVTLDLMQAPSSAFGFLSVRGKSAGEDEEEEECSELWRSLGGAHVV